MKSNHSFLFRLAILFFAPHILFIRSQRLKKAFLILAGFILLAGCFNHFYDTNSRNTVDKDFLDTLNQKPKIFIAHFQDTVIWLTSLKTDESNILALAEKLPDSLRLQLNPSTFKPNVFKPKKDPSALMQVHLYTHKKQADFEQEGKSELQIPLTAINRIDVYEKNIARTRQSTVGSIFALVGLTAGIFLVVALIALAASCSCPQVYIMEDGVYNFKSGMYSGAIFSSLERSDYLVLNSFPPISDSLNIRIENIDGEKQFINRMQLLKVKHSRDTRVLADRHGQIFSFKAPVSPVAVLSKPGDDFVMQVVQMDNNKVGFNHLAPGQSVSSMVLKFPAALAGKKARLILKAANTMWAGYVYKEFRGLFGNSYSNWAANQGKQNKSVSENWLIDQSLPLKVFTQHPDGQWKYIDHFPMTGNTAMRELIMEIDLPATPLQTIDIRLETVYRFWEIDYVALDGTDQETISREWIDPELAELSTGNILQNELKNQDTSYVRLAGKEHLNLMFRVKNNPEENQTYFLCGTGYYHQSPLNDNKPDIQALLRFKKPGAFQEFSVEKYNTLASAFADNSKHNKK